MADMTLNSELNYPLEPQISLELTSKPFGNDFTRYLDFKNFEGKSKSLAIRFKHTGSMNYKVDSFPEGIDELKSLVDPGKRSYWDNLTFSNRGGTFDLNIKRMKIVMRYSNPAGDSPSGMDHGEIPIIDSEVNLKLLAGHDEIDLNEIAKQSRYKWAGIVGTDPLVIRAIARDLGKSGSDGEDAYPDNPKYGAEISNLCTEFVTWYYHQAGITVNGSSLIDANFTQDLHDLFKAEGNLYRYNSGNNQQAFLNSATGEAYSPKPGDYLERRKDNSGQHSMIIFRWMPGNPNATNEDDQLNQAIVMNGPWPVTLRLVKIHKDEIDSGVDFWLGRIK